MKKAILQINLIIILLALFSIVSFAQQGNFGGFELGKTIGISGSSYISYAGGFTITPPPGFSAFKYEKQWLSNVKMEYHKYSSNRTYSDSDTSLEVYYSEVPQALKNRPVKETLETLFQGTLKTTTLQKREDLTIQGYPAITYRSITTDKNSGQKFYIRWLGVIAKGRIYQVLIVTTDKWYLDKDEAQRAFKSFSIFA
jgi:hypothetical protein